MQDMINSFQKIYQYSDLKCVGRGETASIVVDAK